MGEWMKMLYLSMEAKRGLEERLKNDCPKEKHKEYRERLQKEIDIIKSMKFPGYMLICLGVCI